MTLHQFIQKWQAAQLSERSASHQHFLDLCELLGQPKPAEADAWMRERFNWEYKGKKKDLAAAYK